MWCGVAWRVAVRVFVACCALRVAWSAVETLCVSVRLVSGLGQSDGVRIVVSCDHESGLCMSLRVCFYLYISTCLYLCLNIIMFMCMRAKRINHRC